MMTSWKVVTFEFINFIGRSLSFLLICELVKYDEKRLAERSNIYVKGSASDGTFVQSVILEISYSYIAINLNLSSEKQNKFG